MCSLHSDTRPQVCHSGWAAMLRGNEENAQIEENTRIEENIPFPLKFKPFK